MPRGWEGEKQGRPFRSIAYDPVAMKTRLARVRASPSTAIVPVQKRRKLFDRKTDNSTRATDSARSSQYFYGPDGGHHQITIHAVR